MSATALLITVAGHLYLASQDDAEPRTAARPSAAKPRAPGGPSGSGEGPRGGGPSPRQQQQTPLGRGAPAGPQGLLPASPAPRVGSPSQDGGPFDCRPSTSTDGDYGFPGSVGPQKHRPRDSVPGEDWTVAAFTVSAERG